MIKKIFSALILFTFFFQLLGAPPVFAQPSPSDTQPMVSSPFAKPGSAPSPQATDTPKYEELSKTPDAPFQPKIMNPTGSSPAAVGVPATSPATQGTPTASGADPTGTVASDEGLYLNAVDTDIREIIKQISKATGKNFLIDDKVRGKVTILSEKKMTLDEAYQAFLSALEVLGFTVISGPGDLIKIVPLKDAISQPVPIYKEDSPFTDSFITRLITLKNVSALDIASAIKPLISKEGNLFAYPATNTLIVTDSGTNIDRLLKIIKEMDTQGPEQVIEMIQIKNASAKDIADKVQKIYIDQQQGAAKRGKPGELEDTPYISKVIADDRTNALILLASKRAIPKIRELIATLDKPLEGAQGKIHVFYLKNAEAAKLAQVLSTLTTGTGGARAATPATPGGAARAPGAITAEFEGGVKIAADESANALIITATQKDYETLATEVIEKLDIPRRQVYVEVVIMELTIDKDSDVGAAGQGGGIFSLFGNNTVGLGSSLGGTAGGIAAALSGAGVAGVISQTTVTIPRTNADGTVTNVNVPAFGALVQALQTNKNVNILSTPNLLTLDNEQAEIIVGGEEPFPTGTTVTSGGNTTFNVTRQNVGITLKLTPQVNEGEMVKMKVKQEVTAVVPGASAQILTTVGPSTTKRSVETVVVARDEQTIVIGGLIDDKMTVTESKIPFLGDIPLLGNLFKSKKKKKQKTNILVFLRPYIIRDTADFLKILQKKVEERNMFIEQNYGVAQQKSIRESIRSHAAELLEYKEDIQMEQYRYEKKVGDQPVEKM